ncbi:Anaphase-promoting complex, cyclosome, subunit 3 [Stieleria maiorica]|uniref:Anaphase-promoting complex, cyclosome, subunit 3 n=1 Tax=Stieleria maiorica TaxID=2795974 RepID=A0A5B9MF93_9BACT|nr:CDC27 family protein [Stieleria maiorica]QEF98846.1 Anaphase-promoting complex, cyclosome, subunit 3 [Stieleria maiorica]
MKVQAQSSKGYIQLIRNILLRSFTLVFVVAIACSVDPLRAQSPADAPMSLRSIMADESVADQGVQGRLEALIKRTQQARQERQTAAEQSQSPAPRSVWVPGQGAVEADSAAADSQQPGGPAQNSSRSLSEIRERIRILQRLRRDKAMALSAEQAQAIPGGTGTPALETPGGDVVESNGAVESGVTAATKEPTLSSIDESLDQPAAVEAAAEDKTPEGSVAAERLLPKPVNALALGESLYRTGNYESALKAFRSVAVDKLSQSDRTWLDLLVALCQRKLGDYEKAQGTLRDIANEESADYPVQAAKWWLKYAESSDGTQKKFSDVSADFNALLERSNDYVSQ